MSKKEIAKRYGLFILGLFFSGIGVAFTKHGALGVSPISSVPNIMSIKFPVLTMGNWLIVWNCVMLLGQILILRKDFKPIQFLQIPLSFLFGYFTDFGMWMVGFLPVSQYALQVLMLLIGIVVLGFGVSLTVIADVVMNSGEAIVKAIADTTGKSFGNVKIAFDVSCVTASIVLSLLFFSGQILGTREGTILSAVCTGVVVKIFLKHLQFLHSMLK